MARLARVVIPGIAHHVTQRGNRRLQTFFYDAGYTAYLDLMASSCSSACVAVLAYCLMPNHVHLVLVPTRTDGLRRAIAETHRGYAAAINRRQGWRGHLWQARFHSLPLDEDHLIAAVRAVELNPVRAQMVATPEAWRWSSARAHVAERPDDLVSCDKPPPLDSVGPRAGFLADGLSKVHVECLRRHQQSGRPPGGDAFVRRLELLTGRDLMAKSAGRPERDATAVN